MVLVTVEASASQRDPLEMRALGALLSACFSVFGSRSELVFELAALRQQLAVLSASGNKPKLRPSDRFFWALLSRLWARWESVLHIVKPRTVIRWHRQGFRLLWRWKSRHGRPRIADEHRALIRRLPATAPPGASGGSPTSSARSSASSARPAPSAGTCTGPPATPTSDVAPASTGGPS